MNPEHIDPVFGNNNIIDILSILKGTNPPAYYLLKYWRAMLIFILLIISGGLGFGAWKYHSYMNKKLDKVNLELVQYKNANVLLQSNLDTLKLDIDNAKQSIQDFNTDIGNLHKENQSIMKLIGKNVGPTAVPDGTDPKKAQEMLDSVRVTVNRKWGTLGDKK